MASINTASPSKSILTITAEKLRSVKFGDDITDPARFRMKRPVLAGLIRNLVMLLENGLSLPRALSTLAAEPSLKKYAWMLQTIRRKMESGEAFSSTLKGFPKTFDAITISQIRVGERSGSMTEALQRISTQLEQNGEVRKAIIKRLSYPAMIMIAGTGLVIFMMTVVVPEFEEVFSKSGASLPLMTQMVSSTSKFLFAWGWLIALSVAFLAWSFMKLRKNESFAITTDQFFLRLPVVGRWFRDYAVMQFIDTAGIMMSSGFVPVEAIEASVRGVGNRAMKNVVAQLAAAIRRGEKLSVELARYPEMFPPTVSQLVVVGEKTGDLATATHGVSKYLRQQLESRIDAIVSLIEPILTLLMAVLIGCIVMAIYMPMFNMLDAME